MSETINISYLASTVSEGLFSTFGWKLHEITDENFTCLKVEKHKTQGSGGKHPVDCVFSYEDPFSNKVIYQLFDLKSYSKETINSKDFAPYFRGLAKAIDCASLNQVWKSRYIDSNISDWKIDAVLFVYNHDNDYDRDFLQKAKGLSAGSLQQSRNNKVTLFLPERIAYLQSVINDLKSSAGGLDLHYRSCRFFYPQQILHPPGESLLPVASIELLTGKLIIAAMGQKNEKPCTYFGYTTEAGSVNEFEYIITYLYRKGVVSLAEKIYLKGPFLSPEAFQNFKIAKFQFLARHYNMIEIENSLSKIELERMALIKTNFSPIDETLQRSK